MRSILASFPLPLIAAYLIACLTAPPARHATIVSPDPLAITEAGHGEFTSTHAALGLKARYTANSFELGSSSQRAVVGSWNVRLSGTTISADGQEIEQGDRIERTSDRSIRFVGKGASIEYVSSSDGIRQNFIIDHVSHAAHELNVRLMVDGAAIYRAHDREVQFYHAGRKGPERSLTYNGLLAYDATGRELPARFTVDGQALNIRVEATGATYPVTIDPLSTTATWSVECNEAGARLGRMARTAGDVNGDGYSDVVVSAPLLNAGFTDAGKVFVYHGGPTGLSLTPAWTRSGTAASQEYGSQVCTACDVNGDGFSDLMIGTPKFSLTVNSNEGRVEIFHGSAAGLANTPTFIRTGAAGAKLGSELAGLGDLNSDGFSDVAMSTGGTVSTATVHLGSSAGTSPTVALSVNGPSNGQYPVQIAGAGDVNVDGFGDVVFGIPGAMPGETNPQVKLHLGNASGVVGTPQITITGVNGSRFGQALSTAGDQDGDGDADVYVGAPFQTVGGNALAGQGFLYKGSATSPLGTNTSVVTGASAGLIAARFMEALGDEEDDGKMDAFFSTTASVVWRAAAGDVNGDGFADALESDENFSGPEANEGRVQLFLGKPIAMSTSSLFAPAGNQAGEQHGQVTTGIGDVNGDGFADLLVTAPFYDNGQTDEGRAKIYLGSAGGYSTLFTSIESNQANAHFGMSGGPAGDVNDDGYADVIIGAPDFDNGQTDEGRAFVFLGGPTGIATTPFWTGESDQANAHYGAAVCMVSGFGGKNSGVAVGAPDYDNGQINEGRVFVYSAGNLFTPPSVHVVLEADQGSARFGAAVSTGGDVNGDTFGDLLVGAPFYDNGQTDEGAAFYYLGNASGLSTTGTLFLEANFAGAHAGAALCCIGDIDSDGRSDVAVGEPDEFNSTGFVIVKRGTHEGIQTTNSMAMQGDQQGARFGATLSSAGDVNNDGFSDLLVGQPLFDGTLGLDCGRAIVLPGTHGSGMSDVPIWVAEGATAGERFGSSVGYAGDAEGDGYTEVVVGAPLFGTSGVMRLYNALNGSAVSRPCKLYCSDLVTPLGDNGDGNLIFDPEMGLGIKARSPLGRSKCRLVIERVQQEVPFSGNSLPTTSIQFTVAQPGFTDIGASGTELKLKFGKAVVRTRSRARMHYHPTTALTGQMFGRWRYAGNILADNIGVWYEIDAFTGGGGEDGSGLSTGIATERDPSKEDRIFPSPADDVLNINIRDGAATSIKIYDLAGRCVHQGNAKGGLHQIATSALPSGTYVLQLTVGDHTRADRFVVRH